MFAICLEASHKKGMGHLYRMLNFAKYLDSKKESYIFIVNNNQKTKKILEEKNINFEIVNLDDFSSAWERDLIDKYSCKYWVNDRLNTNFYHAHIVIKNSIKLITFDDLGSGAEISDINVCGLFFNKIELLGKKVLKSTDYLILNNEIDNYKKQRDKIENIIVTLGGSDTYGVTVKVLKLLKKYSIKATIHIGPSFSHFEELDSELNDDYKVIKSVVSLIEEFAKYDLAVTGGGVTPFEANASGLPCLIIANEIFEIPNGEYLDTIGSSKFLGFYENIDENIFSNIDALNIQNMSLDGMKNLSTNAVSKIYEEIVKL